MTDERDIQTARELGVIVTRLDAQDKAHIALRSDVAAIRQEVQKISTVITDAKGRWKGIITLAGVASAFGAIAAKLSAMITFHP